MKAGLVYRASFTLAAIDAGIAIVLASCGDPYFAAFGVLCGLMLAHGLYFKSRDEKGE